MKRLESTDIISDLEKIMQKNTKHYQEDFNYDKEIFLETFKSSSSSCKDFIWFTRENGTNLFKEFDSYMEEAPSHTYAVYFDGDRSVACYAVHLDDIVDGKIFGTICSIDYIENKRLVEANAVHVDRVELIPKNNDGKIIVVPYSDYSGNWMGFSEKYGETHHLTYRANNEDEILINSLIFDLKVKRKNCPECSLDVFLSDLDRFSKKELIGEKIVRASQTKVSSKKKSLEHSR